jgi:signal transduction histidine kinase/ActR/RegA family two-component response regulator
MAPLATALRRHRGWRCVMPSISFVGKLRWRTEGGTHILRGRRGKETMGRERWEREREGLRRLARVFAEEARGGLLGEALEVVLETAQFDSGAAFSVDANAVDLAAERGLASPSDRPGDGATRDIFKRVLVAVAERVVSTRKPLFIPAIARSDLETDGIAELLQRGFTSVAAQPVKHQREVLGVLVLLAKEPTTFDPQLRVFFEMVAHVVALAAERDRRVERELGYRAELVEAGHMASLGLLTATVAHELRGPVGALSMQIAEQEHLLEQMREPGSEWLQPIIGELTELLTDMRTASGQMGTLIAQLSALSRRETAPERLELGAVARDALGIARSDLQRRSVALVEDYGSPCFTMGRRDNLVQVVLNLVFNAADACIAAGRPEARVTVRTKAEGSRVMLSVDDTGPGVPPSDVRAIFQPFFTTKQRGTGTGLGLKICSDVIAAHHGHIEVVNLESGGASFRVLLPGLSETAASSMPRESQTVRPPSANDVEVKHVFVVDDDELFTRTVKRALKPHEVRTAGTASEAEMALLDPLYSPHLVLCDLGLPGMTGDILHARISSKRARLAERFLFVTGGACSKEEADYVRASGCATLVKPVDMKDIWAALAVPPSHISEAPEGVVTLRSDAPQSTGSAAPTLPPINETEPSTGTR